MYILYYNDSKVHRARIGIYSVALGNLKFRQNFIYYSQQGSTLEIKINWKLDILYNYVVNTVNLGPIINKHFYLIKINTTFYYSLQIILFRNILWSHKVAFSAITDLPVKTYKFAIHKNKKTQYFCVRFNTIDCHNKQWKNKIWFYASINLKCFIL